MCLYIYTTMYGPTDVLVETPCFCFLTFLPCFFGGALTTHHVVVDDFGFVVWTLLLLLARVEVYVILYCRTNVEF